MHDLLGRSKPGLFLPKLILDNINKYSHVEAKTINIYHLQT